ncbi:hypothetical protein HNR65_002798 [Desulfosalsimonas propionicica]|uniref:Porin n=1 Tax=Desulfosalsimonas propionicica TaxID=332175 RepID=A0A7W0CB10_9BACT|nr:LbtU family siderophore porin [Desulfosalsimonas propionicica]MBA2882451.1 hypothetical protein [Desulfosalsimonas propionicica]
MKQIIVSILSFCMCVIVTGSPVFAKELSNYELTRKINELEQKVGIRDFSGQWTDRISISGLLEVEGVYEDRDNRDGTGEDSSDLNLATVELGIDAQFNDYVSGHVVFLWEEDDTEPVDLDEGFITLRPGRASPFYLTAGKLYVPFGNFETHMVSDPLTLELGETRESAAVAGVKQNGFYASAYVFNGDTDKYNDDSHLDNFGANAGYIMERENFTLDAGVGYINNILDSDFLSDEGIEEVDDYVGGVAAHAIFSSGPVTLIGEYMTALDDTEYTDNGNIMEIKEISAWNLELAYGFTFAEKDTTLAVGWQGTDDAGGFLAEDRYICAMSMDVFDSTSVALEYFHEEYENDDENDAVTAQLAFAF